MTIDAADTNKTVLQGVIERTPELAERQADISVLSGGLTNANYRVAVDDEEYVVRVCSEEERTVVIDRAREYRILQAVTSAGIAPDVVAFYLPEGHSVTRFMADSRQLTLEEAQSEAWIPRIASRLREVHGLNVAEDVFDPFQDIRSWMKELRRRGSELPTRLPHLLDEVFVTQQNSSGARSPVLCHNDAYYQNILVGDRLWLIDWEYAAMGDPFFDLACTGYILEAPNRRLLLETYLGTGPDNETLDDFDRMIGVFLCWNIVWGLLQIDDSTLEYDYRAFAEGLLDRRVSLG